VVLLLWTQPRKCRNTR